MPKKLDRLYIRVDANFHRDERYLGMPYRLRDSAYCFFELLNGWSRDKKTDGRVPVAAALATGLAMEHPRRRVENFIEALIAVGLLVRDGNANDLTNDLLIPKYAKWQDTREEIKEHSEVRSIAGRKGGLISGQRRREAKDEANTEANAEAKGQAKSKQNEAETETETEASGAKAPSAPRARARDGGKTVENSGETSPSAASADGLRAESPEVQLYVERWMGYTARAPSSDDLEFARRIPYEFPRLAEAVVLKAITEVAEKHLARDKPVPKLSYWAGKLADLNAAAADAGVSPRLRASSADMSRLGDLLPRAQA